MQRPQVARQWCSSRLICRGYATAAGPPRGGGGRIPQFGGKQKNPHGRKTPSPSSGQSIDNWKETVRHWAVGSNLNKNRTTQLGLSPIAQSLPDFDHNLPGQVCRIPPPQAKSLTAFGSLAGPNQRGEVLPGVLATLVRKECIGLAEKIVVDNDNTTTHPFLIYGSSGVGKTTLIAQAQIVALQHRYLVLPIPWGLELVNGNVDYVYDPSLNLYHQPMYYARWLKKIAQGNRLVLESVPLCGEYSHPNTPPQSGRSRQQQQQTSQTPKNLYQLIDQGRRYRANVVPTFQRFVYELFNNPQAPRVLFTLDSLSAWTYKTPSTAYLDKDMEPIPVSKLVVGDLFLSLFSGKRTFRNGGVVIASTSSKLPQCPEIQAGTQELMVSPYARGVDGDLVEMVRNATKVKLDCFDLNETAKMVEFYRQCRILPPQNDDHNLVGAKYLASGNGNPRDLLRSCAIYYK